MYSPLGESLKVRFSEFLKKSSTEIVGGGFNATSSAFLVSLQAIMSAKANDSSTSFFIDYYLVVSYKTPVKRKSYIILYKVAKRYLPHVVMHYYYEAK